MLQRMTMADNKKLSLSYLRFLNLLQAVREIPSFPALDPVEERLLNILASFWHAGTKITVLEAMNVSREISSTTVHRRLKTLRSKGLIDLLVDSSDSRIKYVVATDQTEKYFATLGQALVQATQPK